MALASFVITCPSGVKTLAYGNPIRRPPNATLVHSDSEGSATILPVAVDRLSSLVTRR